jgi:hypothetical protein
MAIVYAFGLEMRVFSNFELFQDIDEYLNVTGEPAQAIWMR